MGTHAGDSGGPNTTITDVDKKAKWSPEKKELYGKLRKRSAPATLQQDQTTIQCPSCGSSKIFNNGKRYLSYGSEVQRFKCQECGHRFSDTSLNIVRDTTEYNQQNVPEGMALVTTQTFEILCAGDEPLLNYSWLLKKKRQNSDSTIKLRVKILRMLKNRGATLSDPETVETVLAVEPLTQSQKYEIVKCYRSYTKMMKIPWEETLKIKYEPKEPFIPTHEEINALIYAANRQLAVFLQVALTTGARCGEIAALRWTDINSEKLTISINYAEKGSRNRTIKVPEKTMAMVNALPKKFDPYVFNPKTDSHRTNLCNLKKRLANTQENPRFKQIHLHTFRHVFATETLRQTKMLTRVQYLLGHKSIVNTERYTHLIDYDGEKYYSAIAQTVEEIRQLAEDGWSYFQEVDGVKIFRKPK